MPRLRRPLAVLVWAVAAWSAAACDPAAAVTTLRVEGIGVATFQDFTTDRATGSVSLRGDVCVQDLEGTWTIRAQRVDVTGLRAEPVDPRLFAEDARVSFGSWRLEATTAVATQVAVTVTTVNVFGPEVVGTAASVRYELAEGTATMLEVDLQGTVFRARAESGTLEGTTLMLSGAVATTCACSGDPPYTVAARTAEVDVVAGTFVLHDGELRTLGVTLPLAPRVSLTGDLADDLPAPFMVEHQSLERGDLGQGWTALVPYRAPGQGLQASVGVTGLVAQARPILGLTASGPDAEIAFALPADGMVIDGSARRDLGGGFGVAVAFHNRVTPRHDHLHQGVLGLEHRVDLPLGGAAGSVAVASRAFAAISAQTLDGEPVAGPRLGAGSEVRWSSGATQAGTFAVDVAAAATLYPDQATHQLVGSVAPSWSVTSGPFTGSFRYRGRAVDGGSPFGESLDRATPESVLAGDARVAWSEVGLDASGAIRATYDFLPASAAGPGWTEAGASASLSLAAGPGAWSAGLATDVAGLLGARGKAPPFVQARTGYAWSGHELGVRARFDLAASQLADLEVSGRVRIQSDDVVLTPFLAVDLAPWWRAGAPSVSGHGLELEWMSCCGTLTLGYEQRSEGLTTRIAFRVDPRPLVTPEELR